MHRLETLTSPKGEIGDGSSVVERKNDFAAVKNEVNGVLLTSLIAEVPLLIGQHRAKDETCGDLCDAPTDFVDSMIQE